MATYLVLSILLYSLWVYLVGSIARLLYELSDAVDVLGDVWHLNRVILQVAQPLQEFRNSFTQPVHCRQTDRQTFTAHVSPAPLTVSVQVTSRPFYLVGTPFKGKQN